MADMLPSCKHHAHCDCLCRLKEQHKDLFPNAAAVYSAIRDVAELLEAPRYSLGFTCASRCASNMESMTSRQPCLTLLLV